VLVNANAPRVRHNQGVQFLKDNAMQVSGLLSGILVIVFAFTHLTAAQTAAIVGGPPTIGNFFAGVVLKRNGK
jgi:hypothetical protein